MEQTLTNDRAEDLRFRFYHKDYEVGCGGSETPIEWHGKHYLYVWDKIRNLHEYYCFEDDLFMTDNEAPWVIYGHQWRYNITK
jgi:hypothetical protein